MVLAAIDGLEGQEISDLELLREGPSYSVDTLRELRSERPQERPVLILGSDQFETLGTWREAPEVGRLADMCVVARDGVDPARVKPELDVVWSMSPLRPVDISSSDIRNMRKDGRPSGLISFSPPRGLSIGSPFPSPEASGINGGSVGDFNAELLRVEGSPSWRFALGRGSTKC